MRSTRIAVTVAAAVASAVGLSTLLVTPVAEGDQGKDGAGAACEAWVVDYKLVEGSKLVISDTPMGAGDGAHPIRSGKARIRFTKGSSGPAPGSAELLDLRVATTFKVDAGMLGVSASVTTDLKARFTPDKCGVVARGSFSPGSLSWSEAARGYRSAANVNCSGALCGRFGAPPEGKSKNTQGPYSVQLKPFKISQGAHGFAMAMTQVNHTDSPNQTTHWVLRGAETKRSCVKKSACK